VIDRPALIAYTQALAKLAESVGLAVSGRQRSGQMVHVYFDGQPTEGIGRIRIKIEMNIAETDPYRPLKTIGHQVETSWWSGEADIPTYESSELLATKLRALYQRSKGRDLFDLWLGLTVLKADPEQIVAGFNHYMRDATFSFPELRDNLTAKLANTGFRTDLDALTTHTPAGYDPDIAANLVMRELGSRLRNAPSAEDIAPLRP
jgi:predicted nucleotidyltransferase component of viral defense system